MSHAKHPQVEPLEGEVALRAAEDAALRQQSAAAEANLDATGVRRAREDAERARVREAEEEARTEAAPASDYQGAAVQIIPVPAPPVSPATAAATTTAAQHGAAATAGALAAARLPEGSRTDRTALNMKAIVPATAEAPSAPAERARPRPLLSRGIGLGVIVVIAIVAIALFVGLGASIGSGGSSPGVASSRPSASGGVAPGDTKNPAPSILSATGTEPRPIQSAEPSATPGAESATGPITSETGDASAPPQAPTGRPRPSAKAGPSGSPAKSSGPYIYPIQE